MNKEDRENLEWNLSRIRQLKNEPNYEKLLEYQELIEENREMIDNN